jgi:tRNA (guanine37-N1)-methyltransferase
MHIHIVSIFPDIFMSFLGTSLIAKAQEKQLLTVSVINPRDFCQDTQKQIDDTIYGGGAGMLIKAEPIIDTVESIIKKLDFVSSPEWQAINRAIVFPSPSKETFVQKHAHVLAKYDHLIFVCGRYEGIDYRREQYFQDRYPTQFFKLSLGQFITLGGETPTMVMLEAITRLIPGVIKESSSREEESYSIKHGGNNIEAPNYSKPETIYGYSVPDVLLSGDQKKIEEWRKRNMT